MSEPLRKPIGMIFNGVWSHYAVATAPKYRDLIELIYVHDLGGARLERFAGLIVPFQNDHEAIAPHREAIYAFLARGGLPYSATRPIGSMPSGRIARLTTTGGLNSQTARRWPTPTSATRCSRA